jgi:hypothetical protein
VDLSRRVTKLLVVSVPAFMFAVLLMGLALEVWVRASWEPRNGVPGFFLSDPARGIRLAPGYSGWFAGVPVHINSLGLRDSREYSLAKAPGTFRILVLGDSVTFGHGSVNEHTYPFLLEQRLKAWRPDVHWEVWNAGVPGYNTTQELAHLRELGTKAAPDLVVVGFFENDVIDNRPTAPPGVAARLKAAGLSFARAHVYSLELYRKLYLSLAWKMRQSDEYLRRLEHLDDEQRLLATVADGSSEHEQELTPYDRLTDEQVRAVTCYYGMKAGPEVIADMQRQPGFSEWLNAVDEIRRLHQTGAYRVLFFLNVVPPACPDGDVFYDGGSSRLNDYFLSVMGNGVPAVSTYDAFLRVRPSQMPHAMAHATGNSNALKADVLFQYLREHVLPDALAPGLRARQAP